MQIIVRRASLTDVSKIAPLFDLYRFFYNQERDELAAANFIHERLKNEQSVIFIAEDVRNVAVGFVQLYPIFSSVGMKRTWLLNDLYVLEAARGMGVASGLLDAAKQLGIDTNSNWLLLQTASSNITAQHVYEKNGWERMSDYFYELPLNRPF